MYYNLRSRVLPQNKSLPVNANYYTTITITNHYTIILIQIKNKHNVKTLTLPGFTINKSYQKKRFIF